MATKQDQYFNAILQDGIAHAIKASQECTPTPMMVEDEATGQQWHVSDGVCGFATIKGIKGNTAFGKWLLRTGNGKRSEYYRCIYINSPICSQSLKRNEEACAALAQYLNDSITGLQCYMTSNID